MTVTIFIDGLVHVYCIINGIPEDNKSTDFTSLKNFQIYIATASYVATYDMLVSYITYPALLH